MKSGCTLVDVGTFDVTSVDNRTRNLLDKAMLSQLLSMKKGQVWSIRSSEAEDLLYPDKFFAVPRWYGVVGDVKEQIDKWNKSIDLENPEAQMSDEFLNQEIPVMYLTKATSSNHSYYKVWKEPHFENVGLQALGQMCCEGPFDLKKLNGSFRVQIAPKENEVWALCCERKEKTDEHFFVGVVQKRKGEAVSLKYLKRSDQFNANVWELDKDWDSRQVTHKICEFSHRIAMIKCESEKYICDDYDTIGETEAEELESEVSYGVSDEDHAFVFKAGVDYASDPEYVVAGKGLKRIREREMQAMRANKKERPTNELPGIWVIPEEESDPRIEETESGDTSCQDVRKKRLRRLRKIKRDNPVCFFCKERECAKESLPALFLDTGQVHFVHLSCARTKNLDKLKGDLKAIEKDSSSSSILDLRMSFTGDNLIPLIEKLIGRDDQLGLPDQIWVPIEKGEHVGNFFGSSNLTYPKNKIYPQFDKESRLTKWFFSDNQDLQEFGVSQFFLSKELLDEAEQEVSKIWETYFKNPEVSPPPPPDPPGVKIDRLVSLGGLVRRTKLFYDYKYSYLKDKKNPSGIFKTTNQPGEGRPEWLIKLAEEIRKKVDPDRIEPFDQIVFNCYGKAGSIAVHQDSKDLFERPIVSLRLFDSSVLSFGAYGVGMIDREYKVPLPRGVVTLMEGFAADNISHCIKAEDQCRGDQSRSCSIMFRMLKQNIKDNAKLYPKLDEAQNMTSLPLTAEPLTLPVVESGGQMEMAATPRESDGIIAISGEATALLSNSSATSLDEVSSCT